MSGSGTPLAWNDWYRNCWKRWPMVLGTWIGLVLAIYTTLTGYGWHLAKSRLPESRAAVIARNQPAVPDAENAAVVYDQAVAAIVPWETLCEKMPERNWTEQDDPEKLKPAAWLEAQNYAADAPLRVHVAANTDALRLAVAASKIKRIDWGLKAEEFPTAKLDRLTRVNRLVTLLTQDAALAAHDGEWDRAVARIHSASAIVDHQYAGISYWPYLFASSMDSRIARRAATLLAIPGQRADDEILNQLGTLAATRASPKYDVLLRVIQDEEAIGLHIMDHVGSGDLTLFTETITNGMTIIPLPASHYSASYSWDRAVFIDLMRDAQDELRSRISGIPPTRKLMDLELARFRDWRLAYGRLGGRLITELLMPVTGGAPLTEPVRMTEWRTLHLAIRLRDWIKREGRIPLDFPTTDIPITDAVDIMSGSPNTLVQFRREESDMLRVWSVGKNRKDDTATPDAGKFPRNDDIVVLIQLPEGTP